VEAIPNLSLLTSGPTPPNSSELLGSARMKALMLSFGKRFKYVIIDTPPLNAVTDASILASSSSGTILVVEQGRTPFPALRHAKQVLDRVGGHTLGAVMNKVRMSSASYAYDYGYSAASPNGDTEAPTPSDSESEPKSAASS